MKVLMLLLIGLIASGCAAERYTIPDWDLAQPSDTEITDAQALPKLCRIEVVADLGAWTADCWLRFEEYEIIAERNTEVAQANADGLRASEEAIKRLIDAAKVQQEVSQIRQQLLEDERKAHTFDNWYYRGIITLGLIAIGVSQ